MASDRLRSASRARAPTAEVKTDSNGQRQKTFISGCSVQEAPKNGVDTTKPQTGQNTSNGASNGSGNGSGTSNGGGNTNAGDDDGDGVTYD